MADYFQQGVVRPYVPLANPQVNALLRELRDAEDTEVTQEARQWIKAYANSDGDSAYSLADLTVVIDEEDGTAYLYFDYYPDDLEALLSWILTQVSESEIPYFEIEWSLSCTKYRSDGFGGGAMFITRTYTQHVLTDLWLQEQRQSFEDRVKKPRRVRKKKEVRK